MNTHSDLRFNESQQTPIKMLFILGFLMQIGCASMIPQSSAPFVVNVPSAWSSSDGMVHGEGKTATSSLVEWWSRFNDPLLTTLVCKSMISNTNVNSAKAVLRQSRALRDVSASALLPAIDSSASVNRSVSGSNSATSRFTAGIDAGWELDIFGIKKSVLQGSEATLLSNTANLGDVQVSIAAEVALSYITLRDAQTRLTIANENLRSQQETLQITQWRRQAGLVTSLESEQARASVEQTNAKLPALQTTINQTCHSLAVLIGKPPASLLEILAIAGTLPKADDYLVLSIPAETLRQRPDVRAAEYQIASAVARLFQADAARMPNFRLNGSLGLNALTFGALTNGASIVSAVMASVSMPVFDGGAANAEVRARQAELDKTYIEYKERILNALKEVEDALIALSGDRERRVHLQNSADAASTAALIARQRYSSGLVDFQIVLETQRTRLSSQESLATIDADLSADHVRLYKALGGGWQPELIDSKSLSIENTEKR